MKVKFDRNLWTDKNRQCITGGIFYCRDSAGFSVSASNKLSCNLTVKCFEVGNKNIPQNHNTIFNFRRDNPRVIRKVFRCTVQLAKNHALIGGTLIAGDSTKLRVQNSIFTPGNNLFESCVYLLVERLGKKVFGRTDFVLYYKCDR